MAFGSKVCLMIDHVYMLPLLVDSLVMRVYRTL